MFLTLRKVNLLFTFASLINNTIRDKNVRSNKVKERAGH